MRSVGIHGGHGGTSSELVMFSCVDLERMVQKGPVRLAAIQWEFQDPTDVGTLVPDVWPYLLGIFRYIALKQRPYIW